MKDRTFVLSSPDIQSRAVAFVASLPIAERPWEVVIRTHKTRRSLDANALYWVRIAEIATHLGYGSDEMHEVFKSMFLPPVIVDLGTEQRTVPGSSRALSVRDFGEYMDKISAWCASNGIPLSEDRI